jgi:hypothetical protein
MFVLSASHGRWLTGMITWMYVVRVVRINTTEGDKMDYLQEVKRLIELVIAPIKKLPFDNDYTKGQIDMAETIYRLVHIMQNGESTAIAEAMEMRSVDNGKI